MIVAGRSRELNPWQPEGEGMTRWEGRFALCTSRSPGPSLANETLAMAAARAGAAAAAEC